MTKTTTNDFENGFDILKVPIQPLYGLDESECRQSVRIQQTPITLEHHLRRTYSLVGRRESEHWETLTYAVLWLCGLWTISLCCV